MLAADIMQRIASVFLNDLVRCCLKDCTPVPMDIILFIFCNCLSEIETNELAITNHSGKRIFSENKRPDYSLY